MNYNSPNSLILWAKEGCSNISFHSLTKWANLDYCNSFALFPQIVDTDYTCNLVCAGNFCCVDWDHAILVDYIWYYCCIYTGYGVYIRCIYTVYLRVTSPDFFRNSHFLWRQFFWVFRVDDHEYDISFSIWGLPKDISLSIWGYRDTPWKCQLFKIFFSIINVKYK